MSAPTKDGMPLPHQKHLLLVSLALHPDCTLGAVAVLAAMLERSGDGHPCTCWPSLQTLADDTGMDRWTVQRAIRHLLALGFVEVITRGTCTSSNVYRMCLEVGAPMRLQGRRASAPTGRHSAAPRVGAPVRPEPIPLNPKGSRGGLRSAPDALARAVAPLPACIDSAAWKELKDAWRPSLDEALLIKQAARHAQDGRTKAEIAAGLRRLAVNTHHRNLTLPAKTKSKASDKAVKPFRAATVDYNEVLP